MVPNMLDEVVPWLVVPKILPAVVPVVCAPNILGCVFESLKILPKVFVVVADGDVEAAC